MWLGEVMNKLAEALGVHFCQGCGEEIRDVEGDKEYGIYMYHAVAGWFFLSPFDWGQCVDGSYHLARKL